MPAAPSWYRWLLLFGVWVLYAAFGLAATSLAPLVGLIESDLEMTHMQMGTIMGAWQLVYIFSAIPGGMLLDKIGPRWALTIGGLLIAASVLARGMAASFTELLLAVMLFGLGGPIVSAGAPTVITECFSGSSRGLAMGIYMTGPAIGGIVTLTLTHSLILPGVDHEWQSVMFLWAGVSAAAALIWLASAAHPSLNLQHRQTSSQQLPQVQVLRLLIRQPAVVVVLLMSIGVFLFNHGLNNWLPELLRSGGMSLTEAGYWAAIPTIIGLVGSLTIPRLATPQRRFHILIGLSLLAAGASILLRFEAEPLLFSGLVLQGIARSSLMTILVLTLVELPGIGERYIGVATGLFFSAAEVGGVLGPLSLGLLYDLTHGFDAGLTMLTAIAIAIAFGAGKLKKLSRID
ncbi:MAG TPA: MFS transporter [Gammaproteobacteria bacterium]|nr:MFS transporter [Gammaproteobacteria bacterium]